MRRLALHLLCACALSWHSGAASAEVYKWVDENGTIHFTQDKRAVPRHSKSGVSGVEVFEFEKREESADPADDTGAHTIFMRSAGGGNHIVYVRINKRVTVPMLLDTGASDVVITRDTARRLGIDKSDYSGYQTYQTANGLVHQPTVRLGRVSVGGAEARLVQGSISNSMHVGLLGTSFLKHFEYSIRGSELVLQRR